MSRFVMLRADRQRLLTEGHPYQDTHSLAWCKKDCCCCSSQACIDLARNLQNVELKLM